MKTNEPSVGKVTLVKHMPNVKRKDSAKPPSGEKEAKIVEEEKDASKNKITGKFIDEIV